MNKQSGSAILILFVAFALFAALAFAFTRGSGNNLSMLSNEKAKAYATEIIAYGNDVSTTVKRLSLVGCKDTQISMEGLTGNYVNPAAPVSKNCHVYNIAGGGLTSKTIPKEWVTVAPNAYNPWFNGEIAVQDIKTPNAELIMWISNLRPEICAQLNALVGITSMSVEPMMAITAEFTGTYHSSPDTIGDDVGSPYKGKRYACWNNSYFHVLLAR